MSMVVSTLRRFLTAEEVPRWFGLSVVLTYLVGLGTVAQFGILHARREGSAHYRQSSRYALKALADRLSTMAFPDAAETARADALQRALRECAGNVPFKALRVVDERRVALASIDHDETGQTVVDEIDGALPLRAVETSVRPRNASAPVDTFIRIRLQPSDTTSGSAQSRGHHTAELDQASAASPPIYLEARLPVDPYGPSSVADQAGMLAVVLVVLGALFVMHRCLREQLRGVSRIADRLHTHRDRLKEELNSLRIADTLDNVTTAWNELIELTQRSMETVQRCEANQELSHALRQSGGGALADALNAVPEGFLYVADESRFEYANSTLCHLFGWTPREVREMTLATATARGVGEQVLPLLRKALRPDGTFEPHNEVVEASEPGGDPSSYRVRIVPVQRTRRCGECIVVIRDVSQQVRAERAREEFIAQVTHELRTPLTNIRAYTETLSSGMFEDPKLVTDCYNVITKETRRLSRLVEDMLSVSQLEAGSIELRVDDVDLRTLLGDGVRDVRGLADEKNIDLRLVLPAKMEAIRGDRDKLAVVINNLLGNALKYTPQGGDVVLGCQFTADNVVITVKDTGIGITAADQARVFDKFARASDPAVQSIPGTGLGLYTAREIVRCHRGELEVISEKGNGSTFLVKLPHRGSRAAALTAAREA